MSLRHFHVLLSLLLVWLLAMQSVAVKADVHQFHQPVSEISISKHAQPTVHQHSMEAKQIHDCHHCCHCHGGNHLYILSNQPQLTLNVRMTPSLEQADRVHRAVHIPAIRPPIA